MNELGLSPKMVIKFREMMKSTAITDWCR